MVQGAVISIGMCLMGCSNVILCDWSEMLPSRFDLLAPYFRSPFIVHPIDASWHLIWWCLPVSSSTSTR